MDISSELHEACCKLVYQVLACLFYKPPPRLVIFYPVQLGEMCITFVTSNDHGTITFPLSSDTTIFDHDRHFIRAPGALP